jgi:hypothetical protein
MSRFIDPVIADLQTEYGQALSEGRRWRRHSVRLSGYIAFLKVFVICDWSPHEDTRALLRAARVSLVATALVTAVLEAMVLPRYWSDPGDRWTLLVLLIPQALTVSIPLGLTIGVGLGLAPHRVSARLAAVVAAAALVVSMGSVANVGWILPNANQAFRIAMYEGLARLRGRQDLLPLHLERGDAELTFGELGQRIQSAGTSLSGSYERGRTNRLRTQYHTRWSLAFASLALTLFSTSLAASARRRWVVGVGAVAAFIGYYIILYFGHRLASHGDLSPALAAWLANAVTLMVSALLVLRARWPHAGRLADGQAFRA